MESQAKKLLSVAVATLQGSVLNKDGLELAKKVMDLLSVGLVFEPCILYLEDLINGYISLARLIGSEGKPSTRANSGG